MTLGKIDGFTQGLKPSSVRALERLYRRRIDPDQSVSPELVRELATLSGELRRRIGLLLDRRGGVTHVFLGDAKQIVLPALRKRRGEGRLRGTRWITTLLRGNEPTREDLNTLVRFRLDLLVLIGVDVDACEPTFLREVHLVPAQEDGSGVYEQSPLAAPHEVRDDTLAFLRELEERFEKATPGARGTGAGASSPALLAIVGSTRHEMAEDTAELRELAQAAGLEVRGEVSQRRARPDPHTLVGSGRVNDLAALALTTDAEVVVFNQELAPRQLVALEDRLNLRVIDRTQLILDLFARRARTHAGKLQVESARLRYMLPRLLGKGTGLSQIGGGKGAGFGRTKGAGEKKLEIDRRRIRDRITALEKDLARLKSQRNLRRGRRQKNRLPHVALVGYTNVGKSTLFNQLTNAGVLEEDSLFASLDPTLRQRRLPSGRRAIFSDSVGFIRRLPKDLVEAFAATLDELEDATLLVHVADASDARSLERVEAVRALLGRLGRGDVPELLVFNKIDTLEDPSLFRPLAETAGENPILISAREGQLSTLVERIDAALLELFPLALETTESGR